MADNDSPASRRFTALTNRHMMAFYTIRRLAEHNHDTANHAIESARQGVREWTDLGRRWSERPADLPALLNGATQAAAGAQARTLDLARRWWDGVLALRGNGR